MREEIKKITDEIRQIFGLLRSFEKGVKEEEQLIRQYQGREIFELLQNIDDQYENGQQDSSVATLRLVSGETEDWLEVCNSGKPFNLQTLSRLCQGGISEKWGRLIGCKGIGFRSVLNIADRIEIFSGHGQNQISVRFSEEYAASQLAELLKEDREGNIESQLEALRLKGYSTKYPLLKAPEYIQPKEHPDLNNPLFDTVIRLRLKNADIRDKIIREMKELDKNTLLFLPHIETIESYYNEKPLNLLHKSREGNIITVTDMKDQESFYCEKEENKELSVSVEGSNLVSLSVAIPVGSGNNAERASYPLYCFFSIKNLESPFPAILHANFCLTANRNSLDLDGENVKKANKEIWELLLALYVDAAIKSGENALRLLTPRNFPRDYDTAFFKFGDQLRLLDSESFFTSLCAKSPILENVNGKPLNPNEKPVFISDVPSMFKGEAFNLISKPISNRRELSFARFVSKSREISENRDENLLADAINKVSSGWTSGERAGIFKWWNNTRFNRLPALLKVTSLHPEPRFTEDGNQPCFLSGSGITDVPEWANITLIEPNDETALLACFDKEIQEEREKQMQSDKNQPDSPKRILPKLVRKELLKLEEQSSKAVMFSPVNASVAEVPSEEEKLKRSREMLDWIYKYWKEEHQFGKSVSEISFNLESATGKIMPSRNLYIGREYGNDVGAALFECLDEKFSPVASIDFICNREEATSFLTYLGVRSFPSVREEICSNQRSRFPSHIQKYVDYLQSIEKKDYEATYFEIKIRYIDSLDKILEKAKTDDLLRWLMMPGNEQLWRKTEGENYEVRYKPREYGKRYTEPFLTGNNLPSYIHYYISHTQWLEIDAKKRRPCDVILCDDDIPASRISSKWLREKSTTVGCRPDELRKLMVDLGAKNSVLEYDSDEFYRLLLEIPMIENKNIATNISKRIYQEIIENSQKEGNQKLTHFFADSANKSTFLREGKVLAKDSAGNLSFQPIHGVSFSGSAIYHLDNIYLLAVPPKNGKKEDFEHILGIKPYRQDYRVVNPKESPLNRKFQRDLDNFTLSLMSYYKSNDIKERLRKRPGITLVSDVEIRREQNENTANSSKTLPIFSLLKGENKRDWYIYVGDRPGMRYEDIDRIMLALQLEQIFNVWLNFPKREFLSHIRPLFLSTPEQRKQQIAADFGGLEPYYAVRKIMLDTEELTQRIISCPGIDDISVKLAKAIDWANYPSAETEEAIAGLMEHSGLTLGKIAELAELDLTLSDYYNMLLGIVYDKERIHLKGRLHKWLSPAENRHKRKDFISLVESYRLPEIHEDFIPEPEKHIERLLSESSMRLLLEAGLDPSRSEETSPEEIERIYKSNIALIPEELIDEFTNNAAYRSEMHFEDSDRIKELLSAFEKKYTTEEANQAEKISGIDIEDFLVNSEISEKVHPGKIAIAGTGTSGKTVSAREKKKREARHLKQGDIAEYIVVRRLLSRQLPKVFKYVGEDYSIKWVSGAAKRCPKPISGVQTDETSDSLGHDIELTARDGRRKLYIEVKSSSGRDCIFEMSANEYKNFIDADSDPQRETPARIVFVGNLQIDNPTERVSIAFIDETLTESYEALPTGYRVAYRGKEES